jgi:putative transposase
VAYFAIARGFTYLVAVLDWFSRNVLSWRISNSMTADFCVEALEEALSRYAAPEIFITNQGSQFTAASVINALQREKIRISMDGVRACQTLQTLPVSSKQTCHSVNRTR